MRTLILALAAVAVSAGGALAQPAQSPRSAEPPVVADPAAPTHEDCKSVMGRKMDPVDTHDHGVMKGAPTAAPHRKPLSEAQMSKMHEACVAKVAKAPAPKR